MTCAAASAPLFLAHNWCTHLGRDSSCWMWFLVLFHRTHIRICFGNPIVWLPHICTSDWSSCFWPGRRSCSSVVFLHLLVCPGLLRPFSDLIILHFEILASLPLRLLLGCLHSSYSADHLHPSVGFWTSPTNIFFDQHAPSSQLFGSCPSDTISSWLHSLLSSDSDSSWSSTCTLAWIQ